MKIGDDIMSDENVRDDGVDENGLDYRAGWVEALNAIITRLNVEGIRANRNEIKGMDKALNIAREMKQAMLEKMKGNG